MKISPLTAVLAAVVLFQAGLLLGQLRPLDARAEPGEVVPSAPDPMPPAPPEASAAGDTFYDPPRLYCKPFEVPMSGASAAMETNDATTPIGRWIADEEASYELFSIDFEVGQKPTGYPIGIAWVCLAPRTA